MGLTIYISHPRLAQSTVPATLLPCSDTTTPARRDTRPDRQRSDVSCSHVRHREDFPDVGGLGAPTNGGTTSVAWHEDRSTRGLRTKEHLRRAGQEQFRVTPVRPERRTFAGAPTPAYRFSSGRHPVRPRCVMQTHKRIRDVGLISADWEFTPGQGNNIDEWEIAMCQYNEQAEAVRKAMIRLRDQLSRPPAAHPLEISIVPGQEQSALGPNL